MTNLSVPDLCTLFNDPSYGMFNPFHGMSNHFKKDVLEPIKVKTFEMFKERVLKTFHSIPDQYSNEETRQPITRKQWTYLKDFHQAHENSCLEKYWCVIASLACGILGSLSGLCLFTCSGPPLTAVGCALSLGSTGCLAPPTLWVQSYCSGPTVLNVVLKERQKGRSEQRKIAAIFKFFINDPVLKNFLFHTKAVTSSNPLSQSIDPFKLHDNEIDGLNLANLKIDFALLNTLRQRLKFLKDRLCEDPIRKANVENIKLHFHKDKRLPQVVIHKIFSYDEPPPPLTEIGKIIDEVLKSLNDLLSPKGEMIINQIFDRIRKQTADVQEIELQDKYEEEETKLQESLRTRKIIFTEGADSLLQTIFGEKKITYRDVPIDISSNNTAQLYVMAENGNPQAKYALGKCYDSGIGCTRNTDKAYECFRDSGKLGNLEAREKLAKYAKGEAVELLWNWEFEKIENARPFAFITEVIVQLPMLTARDNKSIFSASNILHLSYSGLPAHYSKFPQKIGDLTRAHIKKIASISQFKPETLVIRRKDRLDDSDLDDNVDILTQACAHYFTNLSALKLVRKKFANGVVLSNLSSQRITHLTLHDPKSNSFSSDSDFPFYSDTFKALELFANLKILSLSLSETLLMRDLDDEYLKKLRPGDIQASRYLKFDSHTLYHLLRRNRNLGSLELHIAPQLDFSFTDSHCEAIFQAIKDFNLPLRYVKLYPANEITKAWKNKLGRIVKLEFR